MTSDACDCKWAYPCLRRLHALRSPVTKLFFFLILQVESHVLVVHRHVHVHRLSIVFNLSFSILVLSAVTTTSPRHAVNKLINLLVGKLVG